MPTAQKSGLVRFGPFEVDFHTHELRKNGHKLKLQEQPFQVLAMLLEHPGELVTREQIRAALWPQDTFVDFDHGLNAAVRRLREALNDKAGLPKFVETLPRRGYRFIAPVSSIEATQPAEIVPEPARPSASPSRWRTLRWYSGIAACVVLVVGGLAVYRSWDRPKEVTYTQLTDFTDSAVAPAISPDGHMVAFIRGSQPFLSSDQIYVKVLPNGEARRLTDDKRPKYGLTFSPDGSEIAYTVLDHFVFSTYEVSVLGGEPQLLLKNAAGLVWLDARRLLYSEIQTGVHMGVVSARLSGSNPHKIYIPAHQRGMAHYSSPSPNRRWALIVEMNGNGAWGACQLVALEGQGPPRSVGPAGACTSAAWSPNGDWMYFTAWMKGHSHIWRQRFPNGKPEQITFGPTEEEGLAVEPQGGALITSLGVQESAIWIHDEKGERPLSSEGEVVSWPSPPVFGPGASTIYYLLRHGVGSGAELWRSIVDSGKSEAVLPGISMTAFDLSQDGKSVVYTTVGPDGSTQLWLSPVDRSSPATNLGVSGVRSPHFGLGAKVLFLHTEGNANYLEQINLDGSHRSRIFPYSVFEFQGISPNRRWITAMVALTPGKYSPAIMAIPLGGGAPRRICVNYCTPRWSTDGRFLFVPVEKASRTNPGRSLAIPLGPGENLSDFPSGGIPPLAQPGVVRGSQSVKRAELVPGKDPEHYAWVDATVHRNLYRVSLP